MAQNRELWKINLPKSALSTHRNIIVMTDEAHRSQYGEEHWDVQSQQMKKGFSQKMREALPNGSIAVWKTCWAITAR